MSSRIFKFENRNGFFFRRGDADYNDDGGASHYPRGAPAPPSHQAPGAPPLPPSEVAAPPPMPGFKPIEPLQDNGTASASGWNSESDGEIWAGKCGIIEKKYGTSSAC